MIVALTDIYRLGTLLTGRAHPTSEAFRKRYGLGRNQPVLSMTMYIRM